MLSKDSWEEIIVEWIKSINFFITKEVEKELLHFHRTKPQLWKEGALLPNLGISFQKYIQMGFDEADASLLEYSEKSEFKIITEDGDMLNLNIYKRNNIIQLIDALRISYQHDFFTKKEFNVLIKWFRDNRNITKRKEKIIRLNLNQN